MGWHIVSDLLNLFLLLMTSDDLQLTLFSIKFSQLSRYSSTQKGLGIPSYTPQFPKYWEAETLKCLLVLPFQGQKFGKTIAMIKRRYNSSKYPFHS